MGNDGGSIPTRRELVKSPTRRKTTSELRSQSSQNSTYHWTFCPLSKRPLKSPVVSDSLGRLFNKDAVIEWLIEPDKFGDGEGVMKSSGVKGLKDVVDVNFEVGKDGETSSSAAGSSADAFEVPNGGIMNGNGSASGRKEVWVCPITQKELGPGAHAVYLVPCGHAFAEAAVREIKEDACLVCSEKFDKDDGVVKINPTEDADIDRLKQRRERLAAAGLAHSLKKLSGKKRKNKDRDQQKEAKESREGSGKEKGRSGDSKEQKTIKSAADDIAAKVLGDAHERAKKRKINMSDNVKSLFTSANGTNSGEKKATDSDFMNRGFTMPVKGSR
ncbi:hypothetical protein DRE_04344 [Drechslerella stenobrocha 248]|uniref:Uncharacterized protein n=1 Tax=Drechslerella stenobrocha 248 TaxID=1043628 RepID=W7HQG3_9PEZI|nr:hypothetical protein DRE_04344 [Drechslerella stenobrocha 248]